MRRMILTAALAAILAATVAACGGDGEEAQKENLHPVLPNHIYLQIQEEREYVTMTSEDTSRYLSDRINAIHEEDYEIRHATSDEWGKVLLIFRKIPHPEESVSPTGTTAAN